VSRLSRSLRADALKASFNSAPSHAREGNCESGMSHQRVRITSFTVVFYVVRSFWCKITQFCAMTYAFRTTESVRNVRKPMKIHVKTLS
jgi:hypothetical protein